MDVGAPEMGLSGRGAPRAPLPWQDFDPKTGDHFSEILLS